MGHLLAVCARRERGGKVHGALSQTTFFHRVVALDFYLVHLSLPGGLKVGVVCCLMGGVARRGA